MWLSGLDRLFFVDVFAILGPGEVRYSLGTNLYWVLQHEKSINACISWSLAECY